MINLLINSRLSDGFKSGRIKDIWKNIENNDWFVKELISVDDGIKLM